MLQDALLRLAERGEHAVAEGRGPWPSDLLAFRIALVPGDSQTVWRVDLKILGPDSAAFEVDIGTGFLAAPGMPPDPKPGFAMWDPDSGSLGVAYRDPDRAGVGAAILENVDLPAIDDALSVDQVGDLALLFAEVAIGWR